MKKNLPIFIVGSPRSGTTLLRLILDSHPNICCGPETSFLIDMERIVGEHWSHISLYGFDENYWQEKIKDFFGGFLNDYAHKNQKNRWADKTPHYTPYLPFILKLFPECQIVHIIRDGRDVVNSFYKRWGYRGGYAGVKKWKENVTIARKIGSTMPNGQYHELRYEELVKSPEKTLRQLISFLNEPWDNAVLNHLEQPHDIMPAYSKHTNKQRGNGSIDKPIYQSRIGRWKSELPFALKVFFYHKNKSLLKELGYQ